VLLHAVRLMEHWAVARMGEEPVGSNRVPELVSLAERLDVRPEFSRMGYPWCAFSAFLAALVPVAGRGRGRVSRRPRPLRLGFRRGRPRRPRSAARRRPRGRPRANRGRQLRRRRPGRSPRPSVARGTRLCPRFVGTLTRLGGNPG
jgi:hypothetical protein